MAFDTDISSAVQQFVFTQSGGVVTQPVNGSYIQAYCEYLGIVAPVNDSWLQALCIYEGITEPLNGSWTIALANYYGLNYPTGGTWWMALAGAQGVQPPADLIWNEVLTQWQLETTEWKNAAAPSTPTITSGPDYTVNFPIFTGTADANNRITLTVDSTTYNGVADGTGNWSIQTTTSIVGSAGGTAYNVDIFTTNPLDGLNSATLNTPITITVSLKTIIVQMDDNYGDAWNGGSMEIQKEVTPGNWVGQEYEGNPYYYLGDQQFATALPGDRVFYKTQWGITALLFNRWEYGVNIGGIPPYPTGQVWYNTEDIRTILLEPGFNYRTVALTPDPYIGEVSYRIRDGETQYIYGTNGNWTPGAIQLTFTL